MELPATEKLGKSRQQPGWKVFPATLLGLKVVWGCPEALGWMALLGAAPVWCQCLCPHRDDVQAPV